VGHQTNTTSAQQRVLRTDPKEKTTPLLCRCPATGAVIQFFQKFKQSWNEQNHVGGGGGVMIPILSAAIRLTETDKQIYMRSSNGRGPSDKHHLCHSTGPQKGLQRKDHPTAVPLPSNRSRHPIFPKMLVAQKEENHVGEDGMIPIRSAAIRLTGGERERERMWGR
jgi:hypothetical protein